MKKLLALSVAACMFAFGASAQTDRAAATTTNTMSSHRSRAHKQEKEQMMKQLNLSKDQKAQLKAQHKEMKAKKDALKSEDYMSVKDMRAQKAALKAEQKSKMNAILTPDQQNKMAEMKKQRMAQRGSKKMNTGNQ